MLIVVNVCYEWKIIHWSQSPGINLLGFVQCVFIQLLSRGSTMDHLVTALWHIMGNLKFIVNQNRGRGRTSYRLPAKLGQEAD